MSGVPPSVCCGEWLGETFLLVQYGYCRCGCCEDGQCERCWEFWDDLVLEVVSEMLAHDVLVEIVLDHDHVGDGCSCGLYGYGAVPDVFL
jgi:hypothetical protein